MSPGLTRVEGRILPASGLPSRSTRSGQTWGGQVTPGDVLPTPTPFPTIGPTPDLEATRTVIEAVDAQRRLEEQGTRTAIEAQEEAERYAASLEATRVAELPTATPTPLPTATPTPTPTPLPTATPTPTPTPTPEPTPTPLPPPPTPTPHPRIYCQEWEGMVLDWIREGNSYSIKYGRVVGNVPNHPRLSAQDAKTLCVISFPTGILIGNEPKVVGEEKGQLLPGLYEYREGSEKRVVRSGGCKLTLNVGEPDKEQVVRVSYGEPFTFRFFVYHGRVDHYCGRLYRIGD